MRNALLVILIVAGCAFAGYLFTDLWRHRQDLRQPTAPRGWVALSAVGIFFLSTLGVSDFAVSTAIYSTTGWVKMKRLPGTLNVQGVLSFIIMGIGFIGTVHVDPLTLVLLVGAQVIGAVISPRFVVKLPERIIKQWLAWGLIIAACFILAGRLHLIAGNGTATGLTGWKLVLTCVLQMVYGALNNIGIGSYAMTTATIYAMGLNPIVAFPIMMSGSALSVAAGSSLFIHYGDYDRQLVSVVSVAGILGVVLGLMAFSHFNIAIISWLILGVLFYTAGNLLYGLHRSRV
ncbi:sulfite exporter TauE/SafE family protein [Furfurilactobacillus sp. WILCCON 0119]|uniref:sulfite exporter TauE/SafE family protein n=1 Tax=Furfurilactobacillus entadae TaxID=2922307 RepID=UPI0035EFFCD2